MWMFTWVGRKRAGEASSSFNDAGQPRRDHGLRHIPGIFRSDACATEATWPSAAQLPVGALGLRAYTALWPTSL
eukprot:4876706-Pyramimonas_sp.AAC.1